MLVVYQSNIENQGLNNKYYRVTIIEMCDINIFDFNINTQWILLATMRKIYSFCKLKKNQNCKRSLGNFMQSLLLLLSQSLKAVLFAFVSPVMQGKLEFSLVWMYTTHSNFY